MKTVFSVFFFDKNLVFWDVRYLPVALLNGRFFGTGLMVSPINDMVKVFAPKHLCSNFN